VRNTRVPPAFADGAILGVAVDVSEDICVEREEAIGALAGD
jgi:hypothetical protein